MSSHEIRIDLGSVEFAALHTEADIRREAIRLLPKVLTDLGEAQGELAWTELIRSLGRIPGMKVNNSSSEKRNFIRESGENYRKSASTDDQQAIVDQIVAQLRERSEIDGEELMPISFNDQEQTVLRFLKSEFLTHGGRPQHLSGPGGSSKELVMQQCNVDEPTYREIAARFEHFGLIQQMGRGQHVFINDSIIEAVRSLSDKPMAKQPTVSNTINVGTMSNSAIQQGSEGATQNVAISFGQKAEVERIVAAVGDLIGQLHPDTNDSEELQAEIDTIKAQLRKAQPKRSLIKDCLGAVRSTLEKIAATAVVASARVATTEVVQQIGVMIDTLSS